MALSNNFVLVLAQYVNFKHVQEVKSFLSISMKSVCFKYGL